MPQDGHTDTRGADVTAVHNRLLFELLAEASTTDLTPAQARAAIPLEISTDVPAGRGLVFTEDVALGQRLLSLPSRSLLNPRTLTKLLDPRLVPPGSIQSAEGDGAASCLSTSQALSLVLARWKARRRSSQLSPHDLTNSDHIDVRYFERFALTMPTNFDTVPLVWLVYAEGIDEPGSSLSSDLTDTAQRHHLKTSFYHALIRALPPRSRVLLQKVFDRFRKDWKRVRELRDHHPSLLSQPALFAPLTTGSSTSPFSLADFLWGWLCVNSRCVYFPCGLSDHGDNFTLAPLLDMANHTSQASIECKVQFNPAGGLELFAPPSSARPHNLGKKGLRKGDECFITYGPHSNAALLSEYGFVLPRVCPKDEEEDGNADATASTAAWTGNRYCEVSVDDEMERMFRKQGDEGERKVALLQDRGYWGDYTIHPYPPPAHPSHRLVPALRLLALPLPSPDAPKASSLGKHFDKTRKVQHAKSPHAGVPAKVSLYHTVSSSSKEGKRQATTTSGSKGAWLKQESDKGEQELEKWEATLTGYEDMVSDENEREAHRLLVELCDRLAAVYVAKKEAIEEAERILNGGCGSEGWEVGDREGCAGSLAFVRQLVEEEVQIIDLVRGSAEAEIEW